MIQVKQALIATKSYPSDFDFTIRLVHKFSQTDTDGIRSKPCVWRVIYQGHKVIKKTWDAATNKKTTTTNVRKIHISGKWHFGK